MAWLYLTLAIVFEVGGTMSMKLTEGFTRPLWIVGLVAGYALSLTFLTLALKGIDIGVAYAVWSGLGTVLIVVVGWLVFREPLSVGQMVSVALILIGVVGLNLLGKSHG